LLLSQRTFLYQFPVYSSLRSLSRVALSYASAGRIHSIINERPISIKTTLVGLPPIQGAASLLSM